MVVGVPFIILGPINQVFNILFNHLLYYITKKMKPNQSSTEKRKKDSGVNGRVKEKN